MRLSNPKLVAVFHGCQLFSLLTKRRGSHIVKSTGNSSIDILKEEAIDSRILDIVRRWMARRSRWTRGPMGAARDGKQRNDLDGLGE